MIPLPPMPLARDFEDGQDYTRPCYYDALAAWKAVCLAIVASNATIHPDELPRCNLPEGHGKL